MIYLRWTLWALFWLVIAGFLHYTLPQRDIVRITGTEIIRQDLSGMNQIFFASPDTGNAAGANRDVRLINSVREGGSVSVYRNEDTGFGWPPYLKTGSSNLQAEAEDLTSTRDAPVWVVVRHYGWRSELLSTYPNALSVREIPDPNVTLIPWFNIVVLTLLGALFWGIRVRLIRFRKNRIDPLIEDAGEFIEDVDERKDNLLARLLGGGKSNLHRGLSVSARQFRKTVTFLLPNGQRHKASAGHQT